MNEPNRNESNVLLKPLDIDAKKKKDDCLGCRLTGSAGLLFISIYVLSNARGQKSLTSKKLGSLVGAGM